MISISLAIGGDLILVHSFYLVNKDDLNFDDLSIGIIDKEKILDEIKISDDYILENHSVFLGDSAVFSSSFLTELDHRVKKGLCYYGPTVMYGEDIAEFLSALDQLSDCKEKEILLEISRSAIKKGCCIVHFGV